VPIHADLTVTKYAVAIGKGSNGTLTVTNELADIDGKVELYDATLKTAELAATGIHASGELERTLPADFAQWRVRVTAGSASGEPADVYLVNCTRKDGCSVVAQREVAVSAETLVVEKPQQGTWKIVVRSRGEVGQPVKYTVHEAVLVPARAAIEQTDSKHSSGATWTVWPPRKQSDVQYVAFRITGTPGKEREANGLLIAVTPLDNDAP